METKITNSNVEEAMLSLDMRLQSEAVNTYVPDIDLEVVKQALSDKDEEIEVREKNRKEFLKEHLKQQDDAYEMLSTINAIEEVVKEFNDFMKYNKDVSIVPYGNPKMITRGMQDNYMLRLEMLEKSSFYKIKQILEEHNVR